MKNYVLGAAATSLAFFIVFLGIFAPNFIRSSEVRKFSDATAAFKKLIEAEDEYFQANGTYLPLEGDLDSEGVRHFLGKPNVKFPRCEIAVSVSDLAFTAEMKAPVGNTEFNYLGYVRTAPGKHGGGPGKMGVCPAEGVYAGSRRLVNTVGPCSADSWKTLAVASGSKKRLAIETLPIGADVFLDGKWAGKTVAFDRTISAKYGYLFVAEPPNAPLSVVVSKEGYSSVSFTVDWGDFTYQATIPLKKTSR